ncbi:uncharacterized protein DUF4262 [Prauserella shujinwangii]|uniref:Uncharacterized protein DUF4262 n=1 Tax=Prauserella shujinwangii TaxID=1453103 RepID=A0A2T0LT31_9PSEU|nr:DUF4262 domain-containing protein [Prauserella shujinwangii]PRX46773.1 uncharacterized protein DUF4262 [Prauserella shujinwangii]
MNHGTYHHRPGSDHERWTRETIARCGWAVQYVFGDDEEPPFGYTIGLHALGHPELVVCGTDQYTAGGVLNALGALVRAGRPPERDRPISVRGWPHRLWLLAVLDSSGHLLGANARYRRCGDPPVPALQAVHDDLWGRFPWEPGYALEPGRQPLLGLPPAR